MRQTCILRVAQLLGLAAFLTGTASVFGDNAPRNVILIGWDGTQRNHLKEMIASNDVPNLSALAKEGKLVDIDVTSGRTDTKAGWAQILTGYKPDKTGVYSNGRYQPVPVGYSMFERLQAFFGKSEIATVAIIAKKDHVDADPPTKVPFDQRSRGQQEQGQVDKTKPCIGNVQAGEVIEENGQKFVRVSGKPWYNVARCVDLWVNGLGENKRVGRRVLQELEKRRDQRFFFFVQFTEPDQSGHKYGENSRAYTDAIKSNDEWTGKIIRKLKVLGLYSQTLVYVTADHGFDEAAKDHGNAPYVFLATNDPKINRDGDRCDIAPTILKRFGVDLAKIQPPLDGVPLDEPALVRKAPETLPADYPGKDNGSVRSK